MRALHELKRIGRFPSAVLGLVASVMIIIISLTGPAIAPFDVSETTIADRVGERLLSPSSRHFLGTDHLGTDVLSLLLAGAPYTIFTGIFTAFACTVIGTAIGILCGYFQGSVDFILMRVTDIILAFPSLLLVILIAASLGPGLSSISLALIFSGWAALARIVRSLVLAVKQEEYIKAATAIGCSEWGIIKKHILPNIMPLIIVLFTMRIGMMILAEASLSFLGLGSPAGSASWGVMVNTGRSYIGAAPWCSIGPATAIAVTVLAFNFLGDGLRDLLDPKLRGRL